jgi:hypothetical protein
VGLLKKKKIKKTFRLKLTPGPVKSDIAASYQKYYFGG